MNRRNSFKGQYIYVIVAFFTRDFVFTVIILFAINRTRINMAHLMSKIETFLLEEYLDSLCGASAIYLMIENNILPSLECVREIVDRAVNLSLLKIEEIDRKIRILELSTQISSGYISIKGLKAFKALNIERELPPDYSHEEIVANINKLKYKLEHSGSEIDVNLYGSLRQALKNINSSELTWQDPEANMVLSDDSGLIKNLGHRQKNVFLNHGRI